jgi:4-hydroxy-tetrahydrodipicolinate synthase
MMRLLAVIRTSRPDFSFLVGWDPVLLPLMLMGADGGTSAPSGVVPELTAKLWSLAQAGPVNLDSE